jgi:hypothetical protein
LRSAIHRHPLGAGKNMAKRGCPTFRAMKTIFASLFELPAKSGWAAL